MPEGAKGKGTSQFMEMAGQELGAALDAGHPEPLADDSVKSLNLELRLVRFREFSRWRNVTAVLGGAMMNDPGEYELELAVIDPRENAEIATAGPESAPSIRGLLFGNSFSRQSAVRKNIRNQTGDLGKYWDAKQAACSVRARK